MAKEIQEKEIKIRTISVKISNSVYVKLKEKTGKDGISTSKFLSGAVDDYLNGHMILNKMSPHFTYSHKTDS